jgi:hypothetical protein
VKLGIDLDGVEATRLSSEKASREPGGMAAGAALTAD